MTSETPPEASGENIGHEMHRWAQDLAPIWRSLTGHGVRETLAYIQGILPDLQIREVASGEAAFDWTVPDEWTLRDAWIENEAGERVVDLADHPLHVVGYSVPVDRWMDRAELDQHLHSLPDQPDAIPYITSYYAPRWGFCLSHRQRLALPEGRYRAVVDATLAPGSLTYGELLIPGETEEEILLSTYVCHPAMANNELSGVVVTTALARYLASGAAPFSALIASPEASGEAGEGGSRQRRYSYRIVFVPETLGSIVYIQRNLEVLRERVRAGFVLTCIGDERATSMVPTRWGDTASDRVARHVLKHLAPEHTEYSFLERGSDERQYCSPGVDLPIASLMRSKYGTYPEYHTSLDDLDFVTPAGLAGGLAIARACVDALDADRIPVTTTPCEPQLGKRGLYPTLSTRDRSLQPRALVDLLAHADGHRTLLEIADVIGVPMDEAVRLCSRLEDEGLIDSFPTVPERPPRLRRPTL